MKTPSFALLAGCLVVVGAWLVGGATKSDAERKVTSQAEQSNDARLETSETDKGAELIATAAPPRWPVPEVDPFKSLKPPPAPASDQPEAAQTPPQPATPPPMPLRFMGRVMNGNGAESVFLRMENRLFQVVPGETIADVYRVERVSSTSVEVTYLPLDVRQNVPTQ